MCPASFGTFVKLRTNLRTADELQHVLRIIPVAAEKCLAPREKLKRPKKQIYAKKKEVNGKMPSAMQLGSTLAFVLAPRLSEDCISFSKFQVAQHKGRTFLLPHRGRRQSQFARAVGGPAPDLQLDLVPSLVT